MSPCPAEVAETGSRKTGVPTRARRNLSARTCVGIVLLGAALGAGLEFSGIGAGFSSQLSDKALQQRDVPDKPGDIVIVQISDDDVEARGMQFPWPRSEQAKIFESLAARKPGVIGVDLIYSEPSSPAEDAALADAIGGGGNVLGAYFFRQLDDIDTGEAEPSATTRVQQSLIDRSTSVMGADLSHAGWHLGQHPLLPIDVVSGQLSRLGHIEVPPESDSVIRRLPLVVCDGERFHPSFALQTILLHLGVDWSHVRLKSGELSIANVPGRGAIRIPLDRRGCMIIPFSKNSLDRLQGVSVVQLVDEGVAPEMRDRIVLVGAAVTGGGDLHATPLKGKVLGLHVHALAIQGILDGDFIREAGWVMRTAAIVVAGAAVVLLINVLGPWLGGLASLLVAGGTAFASLPLLSEFGIWLPPAGPSASALAAVGLALVASYSAAESRRVQQRGIFGRFFGPMLSRRLIESASLPDGFGTRREITVFFSDLVDYTPKTEELEPEELLGVLNKYFQETMEVAFRHGATVNQLMGDGMMAFFNDPIPQENHATRAIAMAGELQTLVASLSDRLADAGRPRLEVRMGIATGYATIGLVGSHEFSTYTAVGSVVNLASRLCDHAGRGEVLVNSRTYHLTRNQFQFEDAGETLLKGISQPVPTFQLVSDQEQGNMSDADVDSQSADIDTKL